MRRRRTVPPVADLTPARGLDVAGGVIRLPADATPADVEAWRARLLTPADLEARAVAADLAARAQLAEVLRPFDRAERRELVVWAMRTLVDAPTAPDTRKDPAT